MKVFTLTFVAVLLIGNASAAKIRRSEKRTALEISKTSETGDTAKAEITEVVADKKEKEIHKRGILHYGGALPSASGLWPKTYASHYGYGLHLPAASSFPASPLPLHSPSLLRYNTGFHYKSLPAPSLLTGVPTLNGASGFSAAFPTFSSISPAVPHAHHAATAQPFIIRPGAAVVQSYSVTYPHRKGAVAVKPVHAFGSVAPVQHLHPVQPVHSFQHVHPIPPVDPVAAIQPVQPVAAVQPVQPVAGVQPFHHLQPVQPVQHLHPVQPVQSVVQVQHFKPPVHYDITQQFPSFFQTPFVPPAPVAAIPQAPTVSFTTVQHALPDIPNFLNPPAFPTIPAIPTVPIQPVVPEIPAVPAIPAIPNIPTIPSIPNFPQPQVPANSFFPVNVQPPLNQKPPTFASVHPPAQLPGIGPVAGNRPDFGSADASPQSPAQPLPSPEPELPPPQPEPTQQPWKPVLYEPPIVDSTVSRPSHTLLPPYGNSPAQGYLPPATSSNSGRILQEYNIDNSLFDNLSEADIRQIFAEASLAAQRDHHNHHHTVHTYHSRY